MGQNTRVAAGHSCLLALLTLALRLCWPLAFPTRERVWWADLVTALEGAYHERSRQLCFSTLGFSESVHLTNLGFLGLRDK